MKHAFSDILKNHRNPILRVLYSKLHKVGIFPENPSLLKSTKWSRSPTGQSEELQCLIRLIVITLQPRDGGRVLISTDHIPLADWAINDRVVIPQSAAQRRPPSPGRSPSSDPIIKFKGSANQADGAVPLRRPLSLFLPFLQRRLQSSEELRLYDKQINWCDSTPRLLLRFS